MSLYDCRQIQSYPTTLPLMRAFVDRIKAMEGKDGILSISIGHCFPYADVPELSGRVLVVADGDKAKADALATKLGEELVSMRGKTMPEFLDTEGGVAAALAFNAAPVVMAEPSDNAGGGAPSDNTSILRELIARKRRATRRWGRSGTRWRCGSASTPALGATFPLRFGGKTGPASGQPIDAMVEVIGLAARLLAELRPDQGAARRLRGDPHRRGRGGADHQAHAGARARALHQPRHRSARQEAGGGQVHQPLHGGLRADRQEGASTSTAMRRSPRDYRKVPYTRVQRPIWPLDEDTAPGLIF